MHLSVSVAGEQYAIPAETVREVAMLGAVTPVPGAPATVLGVTNVRGRVLPVVDLAMMLGLGRDGGELPARAVIAEDGTRQAALAVDAAIDIMTVTDLTEDAESPLLTGASLVDGRLVGVVDVGAVFDSVAGGSGS